ncbi:hypothetical protein D4R87_00135 [bacterium]|nr:MAG: hypothetical protein D4R87_00135 [bacterium]
MPKVITISKQFIKKDELIIMPRREYDEYLFLKKIVSVNPTLSEKKAIAEGKKEIQNGDYISLKQLKNELGC